MSEFNHTGTTDQNIASCVLGDNGLLYFQGVTHFHGTHVNVKPHNANDNSTTSRAQISSTVTVTTVIALLFL
jgi:hypothetical protein